MTINKFGSHVSKRYSRYRKNFFPFSSLKTERHVDVNHLRITNVARPVASKDAVNKLYADTLGVFYTDLKNWPGNFIDGGGKRLANFAPPIDAYDVATKRFVDDTCLRRSIDDNDVFDCRGKRLSHVGEPQEDGDAVSLSYLRKYIKIVPA